MVTVKDKYSGWVRLESRLVEMEGRRREVVD
jgi:hypothetical protein